MSYNPNILTVDAPGADLHLRRPYPNELENQAAAASDVVLSTVSNWVEAGPQPSSVTAETEKIKKVAEGLGQTAILAALRSAAEEKAPMQRAKARNEAIAHLALKSDKEESQDAPKPNTMFLDQLHAAAEGNAEAEAAIEVAAQSEIAEQVCKAAAVMRATAHFNEQGELVQFGAPTEQRQSNALRIFGMQNPSLQETFIAEGQTALFIEEAFRAGLLKENRVVEISIVPQAEHKALTQMGYFLREMIAIIRVTTVHADGSCEIESVLVGGTDQDELPEFRPGMTPADEAAIEQQAIDNRFDIDVAKRLYAMLGIAGAQNMTPADFLRKPLFMSKQFDSMDITSLWDNIASDLLKKPLMMGLTELGRQCPAPRRADYLGRRQRSLDFQKRLKPIGHAVAQQIKLRRTEARGSNAKAVHLSRTIAKDFAVAYLAADKATDARVYGSKTYGHILAARERFDANDPVGAQQEIKKAQKEAKPTGCPGVTEESDDDQQTDSGSDSKEKRNKMRWKKGVCQIPVCPTKGDNPKKPKTTMVGECSICWSCQKKFDQGFELETIVALYVAHKKRKKSELAPAS